MVTAALDAVTASMREIQQNQALYNTPEMQMALIHHRQQEALDARRAAISDEDLAAVRKLVAAPDA